MNYLGLLGIIFTIAKLTGYISWSWWLVLMPIYAGLAFFLAIMAIGFIWMLLVALLK